MDGLDILRSMNIDPLEIALKEVAETKALLETLITSSESFDYHAAKLALKQLERKTRTLGKVKQSFEKQRTPATANIQIVDFRQGKSQVAAGD